MSPELVKMRFVSGATPPIAPFKVTVPVPAANVKCSAPLIVEVLAKAIAPFPALVLMLTAFVKVMGFVKETLAEAAVAFVVVIVLPKDTAPPPA